jgi:hypothetical protein
MQTGRIQPAYFRLAQPLWAGGPAQRNRARVLSQWWRWRRPGSLRLSGSWVDKAVALGWLGNGLRLASTGRMSSASMCGQSEGSRGGGSVQGWWSKALGAGRLYTAGW